MKKENAIKKLEKHTHVADFGNFFRGQIGNEYVCFRTNRDGDVTVTWTIGINEERDITTDYFPEFYHDNLTQAIKFATNLKESKEKLENV